MTQWRGIKVGGLYKRNESAVAVVVGIEPHATNTTVVWATLLEGGECRRVMSMGHLFGPSIVNFDNSVYKVVA